MEWTKDHRACPLAFTYQLVRNVLAVCVSEDGVPAAGGGNVLVVYDKGNPAFQPGGEADAEWWAAVRALRFPRLLRRSRGRASRPAWHNFPILPDLPSGLKTSTA
jgi:hypothetical protein